MIPAFPLKLLQLEVRAALQDLDTVLFMKPLHWVRSATPKLYVV